jgi:hypothetical protein
MRVIAEAGSYTPPDGAEPNDWIVHLSSDDLSLGTYCIPAGGLDDQTPHTAEVGPGSVIFVPAGETHTFTDVAEDLALVVIFAPPYGSRAPGSTT